MQSYPSPPSLRLKLHLPLLQQQRLPLDSPPHVEHVFDDGLEVARGVEGFGDEHVLVGAG